MRVLQVIIMSLCLGGAMAHAEPRLPASALPLPLVTQKTNYSCGAAALLSVLNYWDVFYGQEEELYSLLETTPENGTHPLNMVKGAKNFALKADFYENMQIENLQNFLNQGDTVILDIQAFPTQEIDKTKNWWSKWEDGHYVVMIGLDDQYVYMQDPSTADAYTYMKIDELLARWHDYETEAGDKIHRYYQEAIVIKGDHTLKKSFATTKLVPQE